MNPSLLASCSNTGPSIDCYIKDTAYRTCQLSSHRRLKTANTAPSAKAEFVQKASFGSPSFLSPPPSALQSPTMSSRRHQRCPNDLSPHRPSSLRPPRQNPEYDFTLNRSILPQYPPQNSPRFLAHFPPPNPSSVPYPYPYPQQSTIDSLQQPIRSTAGSAVRPVRITEPRSEVPRAAFHRSPPAMPSQSQGRPDRSDGLRSPDGTGYDRPFGEAGRAEPASVGGRSLNGRIDLLAEVALVPDQDMRGRILQTGPVPSAASHSGQRDEPNTGRTSREVERQPKRHRFGEVSGPQPPTLFRLEMV